MVIPPLDAAAKSEAAIEAKGLTQRFGKFVAVDHVDFRIERGEIFGFLGSNGCGKTTTMKMLTGLLPPTEGQAQLFGAACAAVAAYALPLRLNIVVAIAAAVAVGIVLDHWKPSRPAGAA